MFCLELFIAFFEIGLFTFGGGYAMISIIREKALAFGWLTEEELLNMIAVSESTPGPIAVNMATFVGSSQAGILGSLSATLGVVLPSFIIILLISAVMRNFLKYKGVSAFLKGVRPAVVGLIIATAVTTALSVIFDFKNLESAFSPDLKGLFILAVIVAFAFAFKKIKKRGIKAFLEISLHSKIAIIATITHCLYHFNCTKSR